jgi:hypothetical protein
MPNGNYLKDIVALQPPLIEILDIGAAAFEPDRYEALLRQEIAKVTGFEPNPDELAKLRRHKKGHVYLPYFLGDGTKRPFYWTEFPGCSSLLRPDPSVIDRFATLSTLSAGDAGGDFAVKEEVGVEAVRLDDIVLSPKPDFIQVVFLYRQSIPAFSRSLHSSQTGSEGFISSDSS